MWIKKIVSSKKIHQCAFCGEMIPVQAECQSNVQDRTNNRYHLCLRCVEYLDRHEEVADHCEKEGFEPYKEFWKWTKKYSNVKLTKVDKKFEDIGFNKVEESEEFEVFQRKESFLGGKGYKISTLFFDKRNKIFDGFVIRYFTDNTCQKYEDLKFNFKLINLINDKINEI